MEKKMQFIDFENFYTVPRIHVANPKETRYNIGDIVLIRVGPAKGKLGTIIVERNGNYKDYEPYAKEESIGVQVLGTKYLSEEMTALWNAESTPPHQKITRWFSKVSDLELILKKPLANKHYTLN